MFLADFSDPDEKYLPSKLEDVSKQNHNSDFGDFNGSKKAKAYLSFFHMKCCVKGYVFSKNDGHNFCLGPLSGLKRSSQWEHSMRSLV